MTEFGLFNDEGLLEGQFWSLDEAQKRLAEMIAEDEDEEGFIWPAAICGEHEGNEAFGCEECYYEEEDEDED